MLTGAPLSSNMCAVDVNLSTTAITDICLWMHSCHWEDGIGDPALMAFGLTGHGDLAEVPSADRLQDILP